jgi:hypothetical protein
LSGKTFAKGAYWEPAFDRPSSERGESSEGENPKQISATPNRVKILDKYLPRLTTIEELTRVLRTLRRPRAFSQQL